MKRILVLVVFLLTSAAHAQLVQVGFSARVNIVSENVWGISPGDIVLGTYAYDSEIPDMVDEDENQGRYSLTNQNSSLEFQAGNFSFSSASLEIFGDLNIHNDNKYPDGATDDVYNLRISCLQAQNLSLSLMLIDHTYSVVSSDTLFSAAPVISQWQGDRILSCIRDDFNLFAEIVEFHTIPEPATLLLLLAASLLKKSFTANA